MIKDDVKETKTEWEGGLKGESVKREVGGGEKIDQSPEEPEKIRDIVCLCGMLSKNYWMDKGSDIRGGCVCECVTRGRRQRRCQIQKTFCSNFKTSFLGVPRSSKKQINSDSPPSVLSDRRLSCLSLSLLSRWRWLHSSTDLNFFLEKIICLWYTYWLERCGEVGKKEAFTPGVKWRAATECHGRRDTDSFCLLPFSASRHQAERRRSRPVEVGSSPHGQDGGDVVNGLGSPAAPWKWSHLITADELRFPLCCSNFMTPIKKRVIN